MGEAVTRQFWLVEPTRNCRLYGLPLTTLMSTGDSPMTPCSPGRDHLVTSPSAMDFRAPGCRIVNKPPPRFPPC